MPVEFSATGYGRLAAARLAEAVAKAKGGDALAPVQVIVPSNPVGVTARRLLGSGALAGGTTGCGIVAVSFLTVYRLAELLGAARLSAAGRRPVSTPVVATAVRAALAESPGIFGPVAEHPATETALVAAYRELRDLSPGALARLSALGPRPREVVDLHRRARAKLVHAYYDEEDLMDAAIELLSASDPPPELSVPTVVYLPRRLSRHGAALIKALAARAEVKVLAGITGQPRADAEVHRAVALLGGTVDPDGTGGLAGVAAEGRTRIVRVSDADEEVRQAVRAIVDAARQGTPLERIAVLYPEPHPYARIAHEQLAAAGIAHNGAASVPLRERLAGRTLLGLLALPGGGYRREDVFAWLAGARLNHHGRSLPVTAWERLSREAGIVGGRPQWDRLLLRYAEEAEADAERCAADPDAPEWRARQRREDAGRARDLREFVLGLIDDLAAAASTPRPWGEQARWLHGHLAALLPDRRRGEWPEREQKAAEKVERAIDRLGALGDLGGPVSLEVCARTLEIELDGDLGRVGRLGEGVLVGSLRYGPGLDLDLLIVLGLAEGSLPAVVLDDSLLPDHERQVADGELPLRSEEVGRQHHEFLAALAAAGRQLLCSPRGDLRKSADRVPSRFLLDVAGVLAGSVLEDGDALSGERSWLSNVASHEVGLRRASFPATAQEHRLVSLLADGGRMRLEHLGDPILTAGAEVLTGRRSAAFTRFDGNLSGLAVPSPSERATSATRLEGWAACPLAYLLRDVLGVEEVENPEDRLDISPLELGSLVHEILERFILSVLARPEDERPAPGERWGPADRAALFAVADEVCGRYEARGVVGREIFWQRDRRQLMAVLGQFLEKDAEHRAARGTRPVAAELAFGIRGSLLPPVRLALPDGRGVTFRGLADRLDLGDDGIAEVIDYKTGRSDGYRALSAENPDAGGRKLQLPVYALAARARLGEDVPVRAEYWFVSRRGAFKRVGYLVTDEVLTHVGVTVGQIVAGIEAGVFPSNPTAGSTNPYVECPYCDPDALGVTELRRQLDRKRSDPGLAAFLALGAGPDGDDEDERA